MVMEHRKQVAQPIGGGESLEEARLAWHEVSLGDNSKSARRLLGGMMEKARLRQRLGRGRPDVVLIRLTI